MALPCLVLPCTVLLLRWFRIVLSYVVYFSSGHILSYLVSAFLVLSGHLLHCCVVVLSCVGVVLSVCCAVLS